MTYLSNIRQCDSCSNTEQVEKTYVRFPTIFESGPFEKPDETTFHACRECYPLDEIQRIKEIKARTGGTVETIEFHGEPADSGISKTLAKFMEERIL